MEEADGVGEGVLDEHPLGVARDELLQGPGALVGEQDRRLLVAEVLDEELPERVFRDRHLLLKDAGGAEFSGDLLQRDNTPYRRRKGPCLREQLRVTSAERDE